MKPLPAASCQLPVKDTRRSGVLASWGYFVLVVALSACIPAKTPPVLSSTPGAPVVVTDRLYQTTVFSVRYPTGWRVVTSAADAPVSVVFVAPDEVSTISLRVGALDSADLPGDHQTDVRTLELANGVPVTAMAQAPQEHWADFLPVFERVIRSIVPVK